MYPLEPVVVCVCVCVCDGVCVGVCVCVVVGVGRRYSSRAPVGMSSTPTTHRLTPGIAFETFLGDDEAEVEEGVGVGTVEIIVEVVD